MRLGLRHSTKNCHMYKLYIYIYIYIYIYTHTHIYICLALKEFTVWCHKRKSNAFNLLNVYIILKQNYKKQLMMVQKVKLEYINRILLALGTTMHAHAIAVMLVAQSCLTLQDHMDSSWPGSSVHRILQVRILERVAIHSPGDLPNPGVKTSLLHCRWILYHLSHQEALMHGHVQYKINLLISCTV